MEPNENWSQRQWYDWYANNPCYMYYKDLYAHAVENPHLHDFTRSLILQMLRKLNGLIDHSEGEYRARQCDIMLSKYLHGFNVEDIVKELPLLQGEVDEVKHAVWCRDATHQVEELADVVIYCYGMAQILGKDLDEAIFKKMKYNTERKYSTDLE